jgi:hypothetical protein
MYGILHSIDAAAIGTGVLGVIVAALGLEPLRWPAGLERREHFYRTMAALVDRHYSASRQGWLALYRFTDALTLPTSAGGRGSRRLAARVVLVDQLSPALRAEGCELARLWARAMGEFARSATLTERRLPLRPFLQTYHLSVIREGALAEPFLVWSLLTGDPGLDMELDGDVPAALALRDAATAYNSVAAQQREPVTFKPSGSGQSVGVIQHAPRGWTVPIRNAQDRLSPTFRIRPWTYHTYVARRRVRRAMATAIQLMDTGRL